MMKELLCALLALLLCCGAAFAEGGVDYTGLWELTGAESNGDSLDLSVLGFTMSMDLRADGSCTVTTMGLGTEGTWAADAAGVTVDYAKSEPLSLVWAAGRLEAAKDAMKLIFTRAGDAEFYAGVWVMTGMVANGVEMNAESMAMFNIAMTLTLNTDGTYLLEVPGETETGAWLATADGVIIDDGIDAMTFTYADEMLVIEAGGGTMLLTREGAAPAVEAEADAEPVILTDVPAEAFEGKWTLAAATVFGMELTAEDMGSFVTFELKAGEGIYTEADAQGNAKEAPITYTVTEVEGTATVLSVLYQAEGMEEPMVLYELVMLDDGRLCCEMVVEELTVAYYFVPVVEEIPAE